MGQIATNDLNRTGFIRMAQLGFSLKPVLLLFALGTPFVLPDEVGKRGDGLAGGSNGWLVNLGLLGGLRFLGLGLFHVMKV